jgi:hypothetical protein
MHRHYLKGKASYDECAYSTVINTKRATVLRLKGATGDRVAAQITSKPYKGPWRYLR